MVDFGFGFDLPGRFRPGDVPMHIVNSGSALHEINLLRLNPEATMAQALHGLHQLEQGKDVHLPGQVVELLGPVAPGWDGYVKAPLAPGRYLVMCLIFEEDLGKAHTQLGMVGSFTVP